jgi:hypothetical protein
MIQPTTMVLNSAALGNAVSALIVLYFMQTVTASSGVRSWIALLQGIQRALYIALSASLMIKAIHIYNERVLPDFDDGLVELSLFALCFVSFLRHRSAPPVPADATWEHPPGAVEYPPPQMNGRWDNDRLHAQGH